MTENTRRIAALIATEIGARTEQAQAAVALIDEGSTVPFIARYRKEATGGLDDGQLRTLAERLVYLRELESRRSAILESIRGQGKLTEALEAQISKATAKAELEDLYLPYKPKRRTKADIARERGLQPLADAIFADRNAAPADLAAAYVTGDVTDVKAALDGARDILSESLAVNADLVQRLRAYMRENGVLRAKVEEGKQEAGAKFSDYFDHAERWAKVPGHRALAMLRGRNEGFLTLDLEVDADAGNGPKPVERMIAESANAITATPGDVYLREVARWTWRVKLSTSLSLDLMTELRERAEEEAIKVFALNLKDLLLAAPAGARATLGLDPGVRTGVKVAAIDATGKVVATTTVYPFAPRNDIRGALAEIAALIAKHKIELIAIGNGTASRETERLVADMLGQLPGKKPAKVIVSEAGASVYSASALAAAEFPNLDVTLRGAVSIARRLQDPLAELVKIEPKAIGVGQYQHDVDAYKLGRSLDGVVEDAVNAVGVDLNTALCGAAGAGVGPRPVASGGDRRASRRFRRFRKPQGAVEGQQTRAPRVRAMCGFSAHPRRRGAAGCFGRSSRSLSGRQENRRRVRPRSPLADGRQGGVEGARPKGVRRRKVRSADGARHSPRTGEAGPRPAPGIQDRRLCGGG